MTAAREKLAVSVRAVIPDETVLMALAREIGIGPREVRQARKGRPVSAEVYFAVALACGFDPVKEQECGCIREPRRLDWQAVRIGVALKRHDALSQRSAAKEAGISYRTLSRLEAGHPISPENLIAILKWLGWPANAPMVSGCDSACFTGNKLCHTEDGTDLLPNTSPKEGENETMG